MARHKGCEGKVKFGANTIGSVTSFSFTRSGSEETKFYLGDCGGVTTVGEGVTEGTIEIEFDDADVGQLALPDVDGTGTIELWEQTEASGESRWAGPITITSIGVNVDGTVNSARTYGFKGAVVEGLAP